ncbi:MAG: tetratricopeptide repeat protein, partial [Sphingomicrobium sp.]
DPDNPIRHFNLGCAFHNDQRRAEATESFRTAIRLKADFADAYSNLGVVLRELGDRDAAFVACRRALELSPDDPDCRTNLWHLLLLTGQLEEGWREYEWRLKQKKAAIRLRDFTQPLWRGEALGERVLLLHAEQGLGDTIQFCRYVPIAAERARVVLVAPPALVRLLSGLEGVQRVIASGDKLPHYDVQRPLMSLPRVFGTTLDTIPAKIPYLRAEPARAAAWRQRLIGLDGLRIGLVWAGLIRPHEPTANLRSTTLERLAPLAAIPGTTFISLQKGDAAAEIRSLPPGLVVHDWTAELDDFSETAALIDNLDLIVSVDTSVAHLAGALGKPVWLLARSDACWRWLLDRQDSPWYPTLRLFRQPSFGDWDGVVRQVHSALEGVVHDREQLRHGGVSSADYIPAGR